MKPLPQMSILESILSCSRSLDAIGGVNEVTVDRDFTGGAAEMVVSLDHRVTVNDTLVMCLSGAPRRPVMIAAMLYHVEECAELFLRHGLLPGRDFRLQCVFKSVVRRRRR